MIEMASSDDTATPSGVSEARAERPDPAGDEVALDPVAAQHLYHVGAENDACLDALEQT